MATSKYFGQTMFYLKMIYCAYKQNIQHPVVFLCPVVDLTVYTKGCDT